MVSSKWFSFVWYALFRFKLCCIIFGFEDDCTSLLNDWQMFVSRTCLEDTGFFQGIDLAEIDGTAWLFIKTSSNYLKALSLNFWRNLHLILSKWFI
jgi:hypothetical protein